MSTTLTIDKAGRVVIPKSFLEKLQLQAGDSLELNQIGETITLKPIRSGSPLRRKQGVWVFHSGETIPASTTDEVLDSIR